MASREFSVKKITPLLLLKYFRHKEGRRQMLRNPVIMVIFRGCFSGPGVLLSSSSDGHKVGGGGWGGGFMFPERGWWASQQAKPRSQTSARTETWKSLAHKYVPHWGRSPAELPAAESPSERQTPRRAGSEPIPPLHSCGKRRVGARLYFGPS